MLDLPTLDVEGVTDMSGVFSGCASLKNLDLTGATTTSATTMARMFEDCAALTTLALSDFDTTNVTSMDSMFAGCAALKTLNLSSFNTTNVTSMNSLFGGCEALAEVTLGTGFAFKGEASWLPAGRWQSSADSATYTAQAVAGLHIDTETTFTRQMVLDEPTADEITFVYDGTEKAPNVTVKSGDRTLVEGTDYVIELPEDSVNAAKEP